MLAKLLWKCSELSSLELLIKWSFTALELHSQKHSNEAKKSERSVKLTQNRRNLYLNYWLLKFVTHLEHGCSLWSFFKSKKSSWNALKSTPLRIGSKINLFGNIFKSFHEIHFKYYNIIGVIDHSSYKKKLNTFMRLL